MPEKYREQQQRKEKETSIPLQKEKEANTLVAADERKKYSFAEEP